MNDDTNDNLNRITPGAEVAPQSSPELESLLRDWHSQNAARAAAGRDRLLAAVRADFASGTAPSATAPRLNLPSLLDDIEGESAPTQPSKHAEHHTGGTRSVLGRIFMHRYSPLAAATLAVASVMTYFVSTMPNRGGSTLGPSGEGGVAITNSVGTSDTLALIRKACDDHYVMAPDGGRLDAIDGFGNIMGPCILKHTDVNVQVSGFLSRVNVKQVYVNPHSTKVETLYTFPLSERAAVDRMKMTIGSREIEGQVKERAEAQRIYQAAKAQGRVASLLEQERPNIFTQSIANIEPQAQVTIEISYVEVLSPRNGEYSFAFPTTIAPRYIPGEMRTWETTSPSLPSAPIQQPQAPNHPPELSPRRGIVLIGPAQVIEMHPGDTSRGTLNADDLRRELARAVPMRLRRAMNAAVWYNFSVRYEDGSKETGTLYTNGAGLVNGRVFYSAQLARLADPRSLEPGARPDNDLTDPIEIKRRYPGTGLNIPPWGGAGTNSGSGQPRPVQPSDRFAAPTTSVPDADRITPIPVRPDQRAGHDISITVTIDTGGPGIFDIKSPLHQVLVSDDPSAVPPRRVPGDGALMAPTFPGVARKTITLANLSEIPNRDFTLSWKIVGGLDSPIVLTHTAPQGNFFFASILPPDRADDTLAVPREIMFVLDRSGSMKGFKIEQAKALIDATLATLRPSDTFNVLCFSDTSETLWPGPRRATSENLAEARTFYGRSEGSGATRMLDVISTALSAPASHIQPVSPVPTIRAITPEDLANLPADGRGVVVDVPFERLVNLNDFGNPRVPNRSIKMTAGAPDLKVRVRLSLPVAHAVSIRMVGAWGTENGERIFSVTQVDAGAADEHAAANELLNSKRLPIKPLRLVAFITDGEVGNDMEVLDAIRHHRGDARVFSFAIGNSPNRYLLDGMARLGRGEVDYVPLNSDPAQVISRFTQRVTTPVLTDIKAEFSPNLQASIVTADVYTALGGGGGAGERVSDFEFIPDLYDQKPVIIVGRYNGQGTGTLTLSGNAAGGAWSKTVDVKLAANEPANSAIATLWARTKIESIIDANLTSAQRGTLAADQRTQIVTLGESFSLVTPFTSFVAVDRLRVTVGGVSRLVQIPIEFEHGAEWSGYFGGSPARHDRADAMHDLDTSRDDENIRQKLRELSGGYHFDKGTGSTLGLQPVTGDSAVGFDPTLAFDLVPQVDIQLLLSQNPSGGAAGGISAFALDEAIARRGNSAGHIAPTAVMGGQLVNSADAQTLLNYPRDWPANAMPSAPSVGLPIAVKPGNANPRLRVTSDADQLGTAVLADAIVTEKEAQPQGETSTGSNERGATPALLPAAPARRSTGVEGKKNDAAGSSDPKSTGTDQTSSQPPPSPAPSPAESKSPGAPSSASPAAGNDDSAPQAKRTNVQEITDPAILAKQAARDEPASATPTPSMAVDGAEAAPDAVAKDATTVAKTPVERLRALLEAAQRADRPADRLSRVKPIDPATQSLIDLYINEVQAAAIELDRVRRTLAAQQSGTPQGGAARPDAPDSSGGAKGESTVLRPVRREEVVMHIGSLAQRNKLDEAARWVEPFAEVFKDYDAAEQMRAAIGDVTIKDSAKIVVLTELAERAAADLAGIIKETKVRRRVQAELVSFALGSGYPEKLGVVYDGPFPEGGTPIDGGLLVSIVVEALNDEVLKGVQAAGLRIEMSDNDSRVVVGVIPLGRLDDLALLGSVRRVEMTRE